MAGHYRCLKEFRPDEDSIQAYLEVATLYFSANDIEEDKQVPILLSSIGAQTYSLMRDLVAPKAPGSLSFAQTSAHFSFSAEALGNRGEIPLPQTCASRG